MAQRQIPEIADRTMIGLYLEIKINITLVSNVYYFISFPDHIPEVIQQCLSPQGEFTFTKYSIPTEKILDNSNHVKIERLAIIRLNMIVR